MLVVDFEPLFHCHPKLQMLLASRLLPFKIKNIIPLADIHRLFDGAIDLLPCASLNFYEGADIRMNLNACKEHGLMSVTRFNQCNKLRLHLWLIDNSQYNQSASFSLIRLAIFKISFISALAALSLSEPAP